MPNVLKDEVSASGNEGSRVNSSAARAESSITVILLVLAAAYFALWLWHPVKSDAGRPFNLLFPAMSYLFPAVLYCFGAMLFRASGWADPASKLRDTAPFFALAAFLYFSIRGFVANEGLKEEGLGLRLCTSALFAVCFAVLFVSFAYSTSPAFCLYDAECQSLSLARAGPAKVLAPVPVELASIRAD